jgi:hypothetical protein
VFQIIVGQKVGEKLAILEDWVDRFTQKASIATECTYGCAV